MGVNYGYKRGRLEQIRPNEVVALALGVNNFRFEHVDDITEAARIINRELDRSEKDILARNLTGRNRLA